MTYSGTQSQQTAEAKDEVALDTSSFIKIPDMSRSNSLFGNALIRSDLAWVVDLCNQYDIKQYTLWSGGNTCSLVLPVYELGMSVAVKELEKVKKIAPESKLTQIENANGELIDVLLISKKLPVTLEKFPPADFSQFLDSNEALKNIATATYNRIYQMDQAIEASDLELTNAIGYLHPESMRNAFKLSNEEIRFYHDNDHATLTIPLHFIPEEKQDYFREEFDKFAQNCPSLEGPAQEGNGLVEVLRNKNTVWVLRVPESCLEQLREFASNILIIDIREKA